MPITYTVDHDRKLVLETWTGRVAAEDVRRHWTLMLADPAVRAVRRTLADVRAIEIAVSGRELDFLVRNVLEPLLDEKTWSTAVVVSAPVQYGTGRQYQAYADDLVTVEVFEDADAALAWLLDQPTSANPR